MKALNLKLKGFFHSGRGDKILSSVLCIVVGILFGFVIMLISKPGDAFTGLVDITIGGFLPGYFNDTFIRSIGMAAPIILSGLSVAFAFKTGLFNIGAAGQMYVGGFAAIATALSLPNLGFLTWILALIAAMLAGGIWGFIVGFFKAKFNVNEVITSIMLNYIASHLVSLLVKLPQFYNPDRAENIAVPGYAQTPTLGLDKLFHGSFLDIGIFIAIGVAILIYLLLKKTTLGYQLRATGFNKEAANNAGMNYKRNIMTSMSIAGILAGLGGALLYLSIQKTAITPQLTLLNEGFDGISIALLASSNPIGAIFAGLFVSLLRLSGQILRVNTSLDTNLTAIIIGFVIYFAAFSNLFLTMIKERKAKKEKLKEVK